MVSVSRDDSMIGGGTATLEVVIPRSDVAAALEAMSDQSALSIVPAASSPASARALAPLSLFYVCDVRPAIVARRRERDEDVISHLIDQDYTDPEILIECVTYGAAGMVTTR